VRILSPIVFAQALFVASRQSHFGLGRGIGTQFVGHQHIGCEALFLKQLAHQFHRCGLISPSLHKEVENLAFIVNCAPQPELSARDRCGHLIEVPPRDWPRASAAKFLSEHRPEFQYPSPHRLVGDMQPALSEQIFNVAIAECETDIKPNGVPDDRRRELVAGKRDRHAPSYHRMEARYRCRDKACGAESDQFGRGS
jgi:hypothetical protein